MIPNVSEQTLEKSVVQCARVPPGFQHVQNLHSCHSCTRSGPLVVLGGFEGLQRGAAPFAPALLHGLLTGSARRLRRVTAKLCGGLSAIRTSPGKLRIGRIRSVCLALFGLVWPCLDLFGICLVSVC